MGARLLLILLYLSTLPVLSAPIRVRDSRGKLLVLPAPPKRIVSVAPSNTEILFALGVGPRVVGVTDFCDYPPAARRLPKVGGVQLNYETIISLKPDVVFAVTNLQAASIARMEKLGLRVFTIDPHSVEETISAIELVGQAVGAEAEAKRLAARMRRRLSAVRAVVARQRIRPRVLNIIQLKPLIVTGPGNFMDDCIRIAGGRNIAGDAKSPYPIFSVELAVQRKPDIILIPKHQAPGLFSDPVWQSVPAVRNRRVYHPTPDLTERPGPRLVDGVEELARLFHPTAFHTTRAGVTGRP
ncbi:MAG: ABC transporter substrate-binding protein [Armatimonadota bacterium]